MSAEPSPKANPMDAFQSVWYRLAIAVLGHVSNCVLVRPRAGTRRQPSVVCGECGLGNIRPRARSARPRRYATCASPMVPRACGRARTPPHRSASEFSVGCSMSPDGIAMCPNLCGDSRAKGPAYPPWNSRCEPLLSPTESALPSTYYWPSSHFSAGTRGAPHYGCCCRV